MHDGRFATLREVIDFYDSGVQRSGSLSILLLNANTGTPQRLSEEGKQALEAFLNTFTDVAFLTDPNFRIRFSSNSAQRSKFFYSSFARFCSV